MVLIRFQITNSVKSGSGAKGFLISSSIYFNVAKFPKSYARKSY